MKKTLKEIRYGAFVHRELSVGVRQQQIPYE